MYPALARGHATAYLNKQRPHSEVMTWFDSPRCRAALSEFDRSTRSKKPGRVLKRVAPHLKPVFERATIGIWVRPIKIVMTDALSVAQTNTVLDTDGDSTPLFEERSVFLTNGFLQADAERTESFAMTVANISHHALQRLIERDVTTPKDLPDHVRVILATARNIGLLADVVMPRAETQAFLLPYADGALAAVSMRVRPDPSQPDQTRDVIAVRTWLGPEMLSEEDQRRIKGFDEAMDKMLEDDGQAKDWLRGNALPWRLAPERLKETEANEA